MVAVFFNLGTQLAEKYKCLLCIYLFGFPDGSLSRLLPSIKYNNGFSVSFYLLIGSVAFPGYFICKITLPNLHTVTYVCI